ncbi:unnamed protein product [Arctogadus glacialis]
MYSNGDDVPQSVLMTQDIMEQASQPPHHNTAENEPHRNDLDHKRLKELRNAALQTSLASRMEAECTVDSEARPTRETAEEEPANGVSFNHHRPSEELPAAPGPLTETGEEGAEEEDETDSNLTKEEVQRTQTDHLNKRLLSSFLEKLNERDLALPGVQHLDCAVAEEDSNRAAEDW